MAALLGIWNLYALTGIVVVCFVLAAILLDFAKISALFARRSGVNVFSGVYQAFTSNQRRYAGIVTHVGVLVMVMGIIASTLYQTERVVLMKPGDQLQLQSYTVKFLGAREVEGPNWLAQEGIFDVYKGDRFIAQMRPQKRIYTVSQTPTTEAAIHTVNMGHIFLTMPDSTPAGATVRGLINPLVLWVWYGGAIMGLGVILNIFRPRRKEASILSPAAITSDVALNMPGPRRSE